jgi:hypothetical protein
MMFDRGKKGSTFDRSGDIREGVTGDLEVELRKVKIRYGST